LAAAVFAPVAPEDSYEAVIDVRGFPAWEPGVRRVEVLSGEGGAGMLSEWEISFLGFSKRVLSVLEEAELPSRLRWAGRGLGRVIHRARRKRYAGLVRDRARAGGPVSSDPRAKRGGKGCGPDEPQTLALPARPAGRGRRGRGHRRAGRGEPARSKASRVPKRQPHRRVPSLGATIGAGFGPNRGIFECGTKKEGPEGPSPVTLSGPLLMLLANSLRAAHTSGRCVQTSPLRR